MNLLRDVETILIGKSFGGYISALVAAENIDKIHKVIALGYPLHEEGNPNAIHDQDSIMLMKTQLIVIKGEKDPFCDTDILRKLLPNSKIYTIKDAEHSFKSLSESLSDEDNEEKVISIIEKELEY